MMTMVRHCSSLVLVLVFLHNISFSEALGGFSVEIIHRDSPRSPFYRPNETHFERVMNAMDRSMIRANHFKQASVSPQASAQTSVTPISGEYLMSYKIGYPPFQIYGVLDTGSSLIWMQCEPCQHCYHENEPLFNPSKSSTYSSLSCYSFECQEQPNSFCSPNEGDKCQYVVAYGDGSRSTGDLILETLILGHNNPPFKFPHTVVGCGFDNTGLWHSEGSGIVGLGSGPMSLISQLPDEMDSKFSYCLTPMFSGTSSSKLNFGDAAVVSGEGTVSTPMIPKSRENFYYLFLEALSVGNKRIEYNSKEFANIVIDSGAPLTLLPIDLYSRLESAVADEIKSKRVKSPREPYNLCYEAESGKILVPTITAHFKDADLKLHAINTFVQVGPAIACFAFYSGVSPIFGSLAQQNFLIGYDLLQRKVSFKPTDCSKL